MEYVAYHRVSTKRQEQSGLSLEAQQTAVNEFVSRKAVSLSVHSPKPKAVPGTTGRLPRDNLDETGATIWMRKRRRCRHAGKAEGRPQ